MAEAEEIVGEAVERVLVRYVAARAAGSAYVPAGQFLRDVLAEAVPGLARLKAGELSRARKAAERVSAVDGLITAMTLAAIPPAPAVRRFAGFDPARFTVVLAETQHQRDGHGPPAAGVPRWHPEHPLNFGTDPQETS